MPVRSVQAPLATLFSTIEDSMFMSNAEDIEREHTTDLHGIPLDPAFMTAAIQDSFPATNFGHMNMSLTDNSTFGPCMSISLSDRYNFARKIILTEITPGIRNSPFSVHDTANDDIGKLMGIPQVSSRYITRQAVLELLDRQIRGIDQLVNPAGRLNEQLLLLFLQREARATTITDTASKAITATSGIIKTIHAHRRTEIYKHPAHRSESSVVWLSGVFPRDIDDDRSAYATERMLLARETAGPTIEAIYDIESGSNDPADTVSFVKSSLESAKHFTTKRMLARLGVSADQIRKP
jgi:hypothetical protein